METPILFIIFNRPETTKKVFGAIREMKPKKLFIAADGPRTWKKGEVERCQEVRDIIKGIDWPCEVKYKYEERNLGCKIGVSSAINWFFDNVDRGIILEDDCLPDKSFFIFCKELLTMYENNSEVMMISGDNFVDNKIGGGESYRFSKYAHIWGWATWKRAWKHYDLSMKSYPQFKEGGLIDNICTDKRSSSYWIKLFEKAYNNKIDTWDAQWQYAIFKMNGLSIVPNINLISNIGFGEDATHTKTKTRHANMLALEMKVITHPEIIIQDVNSDRLEMDLIVPSFWDSIKMKIKNI